MPIKPTTLPFGKFVVKIQHPVTLLWSQPCGFTSKGLTRSVSVQETVVPYCDDPDAVAETERTKDAKSSEFTGSGVVAMEDKPLWEQFYEDDASWQVKIELVTTLANNGGYYQGAFVLTNLQFSADRGQKIRFEVTLQSDGAVPWVNAPA